MGENTQTNAGEFLPKKKKRGRRMEEFNLFDLPRVRIIQYTDPDRKVMAEICRIYQGMQDIDLQRPLRILMQEHDSFLEGLDIQVSVISTIAMRDQAFRNKLARAMAGRGFRANIPSQICPPHEIWDNEEKMDIFEVHAQRQLDSIDELINAGFKPQEARALAGLGVVCEWTYRVNARLLVHSIFRDRLWVKGFQKEIGIFAQKLWNLVHEQDPELWDVLEWVYGLETQTWRRIGRELRKLRQDTPIQRWKAKRGEDVKVNSANILGATYTSFTIEDFENLCKEHGLGDRVNMFDALKYFFSEEKSMWE